MKNSEIFAIEAAQDEQNKLRKNVVKFLNKFASAPTLLVSKIVAGVSLTQIEINSIFELAAIHHPIPDNKAEPIALALSTPLVFRHFNQFGQELK